VHALPLKQGVKREGRREGAWSLLSVGWSGVSPSRRGVVQQRERDLARARDGGSTHHGHVETAVAGEIGEGERARRIEPWGQEARQEERRVAGRLQAERAVAVADEDRQRVRAERRQVGTAVSVEIDGADDAGRIGGIVVASPLEAPVTGPEQYRDRLRPIVR